MYDVSDLWLDSLRFGGGDWFGYVQAYYDGDLITLDDGSTRLPLNMDGTNEVRVDGATPGVRRTLSLSLPRQPGLWDALAPIGTELRAYTAIEHQSGSVEVVPQGVFDVDVQAEDFAASGDLQFTAPDRWEKVRRAEFLTPRQFTAGTLITSLISDLIEEAVPGTSVSVETSSTATLPGTQVEDRDRAGFIQKALTAASLDCFFDRSGTPIIRDAPTLQPTGVWTVDHGPSGVMVGASRQRNRQRTFNIIVVTSSRNDGTAPFAPQYVWDNNPLSPTYAGPGSGASATPPNLVDAGPFGHRAYHYDSPLLANTTQARAAGATILAKTTGLASQLTVLSVPNTALDDGDTITVRLPDDTAKRHIIDSMPVPIVWHKRPLQISTRSTVADLES